MSQFDANKLIGYIRDKWQGGACPLCGTRNWQVQDNMFQLGQFSPGAGLVVGGPVLPVVPIICGNCGNTVLINAVQAGLVEPKGGTK